MHDQTDLRERLHEIAAQPLAREPRFPEIAERWERWWRFDADRHLLAGSAPRVRGTGRPKPFDLVGQPDAWLAASVERLNETCFLDQSVPHIRVDFGPVLTAAFLGADLHFATRENTSWQTPVANTYERSLAIDAENRWYRACLALANAVSRDAAGNYLVSFPDLSGATDILANLRGSEQLLMDLYDQPAEVRRVLPRLVDAWELAFDRLMSIIVGAGSGPTSWLHAWSEIPYTVPTCDFNAMIGPEHFKEFALPYLEEQGRRAGRCLFHLDGNDASRHAEALAASSIDAIQYTPGAGSTGAIPKIPMFRMLQDAGKPVVVIALSHEVPQLMRQLDPRGTVIFVEDLADEAAVHEVEELVR